MGSTTPWTTLTSEMLPSYSERCPTLSEEGGLQDTCPRCFPSQL